MEFFLNTGDEKEIIKYLISNSNLPGRRANLELAEAFTELVEGYSMENADKTWCLCSKLSEISPNKAPVNDPREFLSFCGAFTMGSVGSIIPKYYYESLSRLRKLANDPRWRVREAVAKAIHRLIEKRHLETLRALEGWVEESEWLAMRAVAAGVAEPLSMRDKDTALRALELHKKIIDLMIASNERRSDEFRTLRKGLGYTLSVIIKAIPREGFEYMNQLTYLHDPDIRWIIKENLKKNRMIKNFPDEVASINKLL